MQLTDSSRTLRFDILTLFPGMFEGFLNESLLKKARDKNLLDIRIHNIRDYTLDKHKRVDDYPFGGGVGMIMNAEPIVRTLETVKEGRSPIRTIMMSPSGLPFNQEKARQLAQEENIVLVCGRYEGVDERVNQHYVDEELSIGDFVLSGGEIPAMAVVEAVARLVPGFMGDEASAEEESYTGHLLEYPQYTRPQEFRGHKVPDVLLCGDPKKIKQWQYEEALKKTAERRPDLLKKRARSNSP